jgi:hypothetical protein
MKRTITVLQDDIDKGCVRATDNCPIARAATRDLADLLESGHVGVGCTHITVWQSGEGIKCLFHALLPEEAEEFVFRFDRKMPVEPFKFEIEIPARTRGES